LSKGSGDAINHEAKRRGIEGSVSIFAIMSEKGSITVGQLLTIGFIPLVLGGAVTCAVFGWEAYRFANHFFSGDWVYVAILALFIETFGGTVAGSIWALIIGIGIPAKAGSPVTVLEILACVISTTLLFTQGFWFLLTWFCDVLNLSEPIPTVIMVYLLLAPFALAITSGIALVSNIGISIALDYIPGRK